MTMASSAGIVAGMLTRSAQWGGLGMSNRRSGNNGGGAPAYLIALAVSLLVYAISFFLTRLLSRYRELCADRSGAYLTMKPGALASALQRITGGINTIPKQDLRASSPLNTFFIAPAISGATLRTLTSTHPSLEQRLEQLTRIQAELAARCVSRQRHGFVARRSRAAPGGAAQSRSALSGTSAAIALETALGLTPTGEGSVCFRAPGGAAYQLLERDLVQLLGDARVSSVQDSYGFTWLVLRGQDDADGTRLDSLCTDLHAVNTTLESQDFNSGLLCTLVLFADPSGRRVGLVYLYKQGTFYAFAPHGHDERDNLTEIQIRDALAEEMPMEPDMARWLALGGARAVRLRPPGLCPAGFSRGGTCPAAPTSGREQPWPRPESSGPPRCG